MASILHGRRDGDKQARPTMRQQERPRKVRIRRSGTRKRRRNENDMVIEIKNERNWHLILANREGESKDHAVGTCRGKSNGKQTSRFESEENMRPKRDLDELGQTNKRSTTVVCYNYERRVRMWANERCGRRREKSMQMNRKMADT